MLSRLSTSARGLSRAARAAAPRAAAASATHVARARPAVASMPVRAMATGARLEGYPTTELPGVFGDNSFNRRAMKAYMSKKDYEAITACIDERKTVPAELADAFATGLKRWAEERGATHFAHWFQPLTHGFAYKHDSMIKRDGDHVITQLTGKMVSIGEPDGSSFPNGGLRDTHAARGYTVWDPSSPCFIADHGDGNTLCIPSVFFSWKGHALDEKTPLLRSVDALAREGLALFKTLGQTKHKTLHADSGVEQEFFMVEKDYVRARPDLMQTGRTLIGAAPPKGQALDDQYFGPFSDRFLSALSDAEKEMWKLGIPQTTRHREVAPGQYEMAPVFAPSGVASDHNLLQMDVLYRACQRHDIEVLFHEKPFAGVNGSGKHNNWSMGTNAAPTMLEPGSNPAENLDFLLLIASVVRAIHVHGDVLRTAVSGASNDHRLGANEAPPAIMSAYLGDDISDAIRRFLGEDVPERDLPTGDLGVGCLPAFKVDNVDRNRTSPFAFTGNKFEFRAVGSSHNPARSNIFLNTAVADSLRHINDEIKARMTPGMGKAAVREVYADVLRDTLRAHQAAIFDGDNYSEEWVEEAERRGLLNLRTTTEAIDAFDSDKNVALFEKYGVLSGEELAARIAVMREEYVVKINNEASALVNVVQTAVLPAAIEMQTKLSGALIATQSAGGSADSSAQAKYLDRVTSTINSLVAAIEGVEAAVADLPHGDLAAEARHCNTAVLAAMGEARTHADALEEMCPADSWVLPTYHEMLFHQS